MNSRHNPSNNIEDQIRNALNDDPGGFAINADELRGKLGTEFDDELKIIEDWSKRPRHEVITQSIASFVKDENLRVRTERRVEGEIEKACAEGDALWDAARSDIIEGSLLYFILLAEAGESSNVSPRALGDVIIEEALEEMTRQGRAHMRIEDIYGKPTKYLGKGLPPEQTPPPSEQTQSPPEQAQPPTEPRNRGIGKFIVGALLAIALSVLANFIYDWVEWPFP